MNLRLVRIAQTPFATYGVLVGGNGVPVGVTLELPYKDMDGDGQGDANISCIPAGTYTAFRFDSPHIGYQLFQLRNVPGRSGIDMHIGNLPKDTEGCILVGEKFGLINGLPGILESSDEFKMFMSQLSGVDEFTLEVEECFT